MMLLNLLCLEKKFENEIIDKKNIMFPDEEDVIMIGMREPFELFCSMVEIDNNFVIPL